MKYSSRRQSSHGSATSVGLTSLEMSQHLIKTIFSWKDTKLNIQYKANKYLESYFNHNSKKHMYAFNMLLICKVKVVHFLFEGVQYLSMPGHIRRQNKSNDRLQQTQKIHPGLFETVSRILTKLFKIKVPRYQNIHFVKNM